MTFNLAQARLNEGLTVLDLAREVGVAEQSIRRFEDGKGNMRPANAKKVADRFGITVTELIASDRTPVG